MKSDASLQDFLNWAGNTALQFYRSSQDQDPVITDDQGNVVATAKTQMMLQGLIILGLFVVMLFLIRK